jgi:membrane associated rhomboid family serine protease
LGALTSALTLQTYPSDVDLIGASGMVYLMVGFWLIQYVFIERRLTLSIRLLRAFGFVLAALMPTSFEKNVSYRTHAIGFLVGCAFGLVYYVANFKRFRRAEVLGREIIESDISIPPGQFN